MPFFFYWNVAGPPASSFLFKIGVFINFFFFLAIETRVVRVCFFCLHLGLNFTVYICHPAVPYMLTGFAGCSVGRGISRGARKLTRTPT
jgi:hypothetical protein